ncbi:unnamed protein product, partial [Amoebophrya sp. A120]
ANRHRSWVLVFRVFHLARSLRNQSPHADRVQQGEVYDGRAQNRSRYWLRVVSSDREQQSCILYFPAVVVIPTAGWAVCGSRYGRRAHAWGVTLPGGKNRLPCPFHVSVVGTTKPAWSASSNKTGTYAFCGLRIGMNEEKKATDCHAVKNTGESVGNDGTTIGG